MLISNLKELRGRNRITQAAIGRQAGLGQSRVCNFEKFGAVPLNPVDCAAMVDAYRVLCGMQADLPALLRLQKCEPVEIAPLEEISAGVP